MGNQNAVNKEQKKLVKEERQRKNEEKKLEKERKQQEIKDGKERDQRGKPARHPKKDEQRFQIPETHENSVTNKPVEVEPLTDQSNVVEDPTAEPTAVRRSKQLSKSSKSPEVAGSSKQLSASLKEQLPTSLLNEQLSKSSLKQQLSSTSSKLELTNSNSKENDVGKVRSSNVLEKKRSSSISERPSHLSDILETTAGGKVISHRRTTIVETKKAKKDLTQEIKDLTLIISGLYDEVQKTRERVISLELSNSDLAKDVGFRRNTVRQLKADLRHIEKDYRKADRQYRKGHKKTSEDQFYLKENQKIKQEIVENNIDLLVDMTINDDIIPRVYRSLQVERMKEQQRCITQLRERIAVRKRELVHFQQQVTTEEHKTDTVCLMSESLQRQIDGHGFTNHETVKVAQLCSVAYYLGYVKFHVDDLMREVDFVHQMNESRMNEVGNELKLWGLMFREKIKALQTVVAKALQPNSKCPCPAAETTGTVTMCTAKPHQLSDRQRDWIAMQITLSEVQKTVTEVKVENVVMEVRFRNAELLNKLLKLKSRVQFTMEKRENYINCTDCVAGEKTVKGFFA